MSELLAFDIFAIDKASEVMKKVGEHAGEMGDKFGKVGAAISKGLQIGFAGIAGLGTAIAAAGIEELKKNQQTVAQLGAVITSTGGKAGVTSEQMQKLSDTIQNYSGQSHESIQQSEALLLGFTNIHDAAGANNDILTRATTITADMAARMGGSASDNAIKLGKALNDPVKGMASLTRVGVQFTDAQKAQVKAMVASGDTMGAQKLILDVLQTKFGGAAKAAGGTLAGQMSRLKLTFEDVSASIVSRLLPVLTRIASWITDKLIPVMGQIYDTEGPKVAALFSRIGDILRTDVAPIMERVGGFIADHATLFRALAVALGVGVGAIVVLVEAMKVWAAIQAVLDSELLANPIGLVVVAIAALAAGVIYAYKNSETFRTIVQTVMKDVSAAFGWIVDAAKTAFGWLEDHWKIIVAVVFGPMGLALDLIVTHWQGFRDGVIAVWDFLNTYVFKPLIGAVRDGIGFEVTVLKTTFDTAWSAIKKIVSDAWAFLQTILGPMKQALNDITGPLSKVAGFAGGVAKGAGGIAKKVFGFAGGTSDAPPGLAWVGENGPELMNFRGGETVTPAAGSAALAGGGGLTINFNGPIVGGSQADARRMADFVHDALRAKVQGNARRSGSTGFAGVGF